jgi:hypothetical protein
VHLTFPLVLCPDPGTAVVVHAREHLRHAAKVSGSVDGEEEEDGSLPFTLSPRAIQPRRAHGHTTTVNENSHVYPDPNIMRTILDGRNTVNTVLVQIYHLSFFKPSQILYGRTSFRLSGCPDSKFLFIPHGFCESNIINLRQKLKKL